MRSQTFQLTSIVNKIFASKHELEGVSDMRKLKYGLLSPIIHKEYFEQNMSKFIE